MSEICLSHLNVLPVSLLLADISTRLTLVAGEGRAKYVNGKIQLWVINSMEETKMQDWQRVSSIQKTDV